MKRNIKRESAALLSALMLLTALTACGGRPEESQESGKLQESTEDQTKDSLSPETETEVQEEREGITVSNTAELIAAIAPDTRIILAPGDYNFSLLTNEEMQACSDCVVPGRLTFGEFAITNAPGLTLEAEESGTARLITGEGYADVVTLIDCDGAALKGLILGHAIEKGYCDADVLVLDGSENMTVEDCCLFGCGANGISADRASGLTVTGTEIYECTSNIFSLYEMTDVTFDRCRFYDNAGMFDMGENAEILVRDTEIFNNWGSLLPTDGIPDPETTRMTFQGCTFRDNRDMGDPGDDPCVVFEDCDISSVSVSVSGETSYDELLEQYRGMMYYPSDFSDADWPGAQGVLEFTDHMIDWYGYDILLDFMGYVIQDLNGDGVLELMIVPLPEYDVWAAALYTLVDGEPQLVFSYGDEGTYAYMGDGMFFYNAGEQTENGFGRGQGTYYLSEDGTSMVCESFSFCFLDGDQTVYTNTTGSWDVSKSQVSNMDIGDFDSWEGFEPVYETEPIAFRFYE